MDIGLQLYSLKEEAEKSFENALELTAKAGYTAVEFAGNFGNTSEQMKALLAKYHLKPVSAHVGIERFREAFDEELAYAKAVGYRLIICPWSDCKSRDEVLNDAKLLESCAGKAAKEGLVVGYHNHAQEFSQFNGAYAMDILLEHAPTVQFEPDVFWIAYAGVDPVNYLTPLAKAGRICALHAKELAKEGTANVYVGQGKIDFLSLTKIISPAVYPYIVEQEEYSGDHFTGIAASCAGLRTILEK
jgi:sugar phosphate isomerase/epimerase